MKKLTLKNKTKLDYPIIKDQDNMKNLGIILFKDSDINAITINSGILANYNEYQVHYWFMNGRFTFQDGSIIDIAIPTVYFNYKQTVSSAAIDFDLKNVDNISNLLKVVHNAKVNELLKSKFCVALKNLFLSATFEWLSVDFGTIHRHPGSLSTFSGTDLSTKFPDPGICFPLAEIKEGFQKPSFSSIILHKDTRTEICHTEYRLADTDTANTITYNKGRCASIVDSNITKPSDVETLLGITPVDTSYVMTDNVPSTDILEPIKELFKELDYNASTQFIKEENLSKQSAFHKYEYSALSMNKITKSITKVPPSSSAEYKAVASAIYDEYAIKLYTAKELKKMPKKDLKDILGDLEYAVNEYVMVSIDIVKNILYLQDLLWLQEEKFTSITDQSTYYSNNLLFDY